jgi:hypothetical protein
MGLVDSSARVAPTFRLECITRGRPSNGLLRRFYRVKLSRPLETPLGVPSGRTGNGEGGRTAPNVRHVKQRRTTPLYWCVIFSVKLCAIFHSAWAEDRATVGTDPSADPGAKTEGGRSTLSAAFLHLRDWHQCGKSRGSGGWPPVHKHCFFRFFKTHHLQDASFSINHQATATLRDGRAFRGNERPGNNRHSSNFSS